MSRVLTRSILPRMRAWSLAAAASRSSLLAGSHAKSTAFAFALAECVATAVPPWGAALPPVAGSTTSERRATLATPIASFAFQLDVEAS